MTSATLDVRLGAARDELRRTLRPELVRVFTADLGHGERAARTVQVGDTVPDVTLPDALGGTVSVGELTAYGPAVLVFYRGAWCPFCNVALKAYQDEVLPLLDALDVPLVAISPQGPGGSLAIRDENDLTFPVLTDAGSAFARRLGLTYAVDDAVRVAQLEIGQDLGSANARGEWELPMPTVLVLDTQRRVTFVDVHPDYTTRTDPAVLTDAVRLAALEEV